MNRLVRIIAVMITVTLIFALSVTASSGAELVKYSSYKTGQVTAGPLNVRSAASATSSVRGELAKGQQVTLKGYKTNGSTKWYYITYDGKASYISSAYVKTVTKTAYTIYTPAQKATVTDGPLSVRASAGTSGTLRGTLKKGASVTLKGYKYDSSKKLWYAVTYNGKLSYIRASYVKKGSTTAPAEETKEQMITVKEGPLNVRASAGTSGRVLGSIDKGATARILGSKKDSSGKLWYKIKFGSEYGYVSSAYVKVSEYRDNSGGSGGNTASDFETMLENEGFPESYKPYLRALHEKHPDWIFRAEHTGTAWSAAVAAETTVGRNLIYSGAYDSWKSMKSGAYDFKNNKYVVFDSGGWVSAYTGIIKYYLDPRNFLNENGIYMFVSHAFDREAQSISTVKKIVKGTFLDVDFPDEPYSTYASAIYYAGKNTGVNPNVLAAMIIQEQGSLSNGSVSGTYKGYKGIYNFFNCGAYKTSTMSAVQRGLWWASGAGAGATTYGRPWNTRYKSLKGGAMFYAEGYVNSGQDTLYLKKFNVCADSKNAIGTHQYMTNIQGAESEAMIMKQGYSSLADGAIVFKIPVFKSMPSSACKKPTTKGNNNNLLDSIKVTAGEASVSLDKNFSRYTQKYTVTVPHDTDKVAVTAKANDRGAQVTGGADTVSLKTGTNTHYIKVKATSRLSRTYTLTIIRK